MLIEEILDHARIESGVIDIETSNCNLQEIINSCIRSLSLEIDKNKNTISTEIDPALHDINTDETKIKRILINLISNANKFTQQGKITISGNISNGDIILRIKDSGIGIAKDQIERIFEPFSQADNSCTREHGGAGLGLTISKEYAMALGGKIFVESKEGKGTTAELRLPFCVPLHNDDPDIDINDSPAA
jgi:hypothetical protein